MLGIRVRYHVLCDHPQPGRCVPPPSDSFSVDVWGLIAQRLSMENVETVVADATKTLPTCQLRPVKLVVITPPGNTKFIDNQGCG
jgi:hypothetical protein